MTKNTNPVISEPAMWWRRVCFVTPNLAISGDLDISSEEAFTQSLGEWIDAGITDIVDARGECSDEDLVEPAAPHIRYHWVGTDDDGGMQSDEWFNEGVAAIVSALADPNRKVMVHCHMGVNRGPSLAFAAMLLMGWEPTEALTAIRLARPIAAVLYATDAVTWLHSLTPSPARTRFDDFTAVTNWHEQNPVDVSWIVSRIRVAEREAYRAA